jgi:translation initiation factor 2 alpha subunit (eIF-2alpha)
MLTKDKSKILIDEFSNFIQRSELQTKTVDSIRPFINEIKEILLMHVYQVNEKNPDESSMDPLDFK